MVSCCVEERFETVPRWAVSRLSGRGKKEKEKEGNNSNYLSTEQYWSMHWAPPKYSAYREQTLRWLGTSTLVVGSHIHPSPPAVLQRPIRQKHDSHDDPVPPNIAIIRHTYPGGNQNDRWGAQPDRRIAATLSSTNHLGQCLFPSPVHSQRKDSHQIPSVTGSEVRPTHPSSRLEL